jgi:hypothetical protein
MILKAAVPGRFNEHWCEVLRPLKTRGIEYFHAGRCFGGYDEFEALDESECKALFEELILLIKRTAKVGLVCGLSDESFTTAIRRNRLRRFPAACTRQAQ